MAFALTAVQIDKALQKPGCAICRVSTEAAHKAADGFLHENVLDPQVREPILQARGFCPEHTRLLAAVELSANGSTLGINYIYEQLARSVADELSGQGKERSSRLPAGLRRRKKAAPLPPCPLCELTARSAENYLHALYEELEPVEAPTRDIYTQSDGLCYAHLRASLPLLAAEFPAAAAFLMEDTQSRLLERAGQMQEYIRKHDWHYRDEQISPEENVAWKKALGFFTGLPAEKFTHKKD
jgi:hypothetical protein